MHVSNAVEDFDKYFQNILTKNNNNKKPHSKTALPILFPGFLDLSEILGDQAEKNPFSTIKRKRAVQVSNNKMIS